MDRSIPMLLIGLVLGGGLGFAVAATNGVALTGHDHGDPAHHGAAAGDGQGHDHGTVLSLPDDALAPALDLAVTRDPLSGWNLHVQTRNFRFAPEHAGQAPVTGEGHGHVHVNGVKQGRIYGPWLHLDGLPPGRVTVQVTLNANDHSLLAVAATPLAQTIVIDN